MCSLPLSCTIKQDGLPSRNLDSNIREYQRRIFMTLRFSARNQLRATVKSVTLGEVMAEVIVTLPDGQEIVSAITKTSAESLNLKAGDTVVAIIKSTEVMVGKNE